MLLRALTASIGYEAVLQRVRNSAQNNLRRALLYFCGVFCVLIAIAFVTAWGWVMVQLHFGAAAANLSLAGIYALVGCVFWIAGRQDQANAIAAPSPKPLISSPMLPNREPSVNGTMFGAVGLVAATGFIIARLLQRELRD